MDLFDIVAARQGGGKGVVVDSALNENSTNAIQNAVVTKEFKDLKNKSISKWYALPISEFSKEPCSMEVNVDKSQTENGEYIAGLAFSLYIAEDVNAGQSLMPLTDIPFELNNDTDRFWLNWTNKEKFTKIGIINTQMSSEPVDLYKELEAFVDGTIFNKVVMSMGTTGYQVGSYGAMFMVGILSQSEAAIDTLLEELVSILDTLTHVCIKYENYEVIEANVAEVE